MLAMAEGLGIAASIIAVVSAIKQLYQIIVAIHDAPQIFVSLKADFVTLSQTVQSLIQELMNQDGNAALSEAQKSTLEACRNICDKDNLDRLTRHIMGSHTSLWYRLKLLFQEREI